MVSKDVEKIIGRKPLALREFVERRRGLFIGPEGGSLPPTIHN